MDVLEELIEHERCKNRVLQPAGIRSLGITWKTKIGLKER